ncbi:L-threonine 3-dehydrogenase [Acidothermaceae bacterium B102]|nr:L-threonine 3-dehydrogenase [Acidothermaceae bacterium B102]
MKRRSEPGLWLEDVPKPVIGPGDVLVRVLRTGICGTDLHIRAWDSWAQSAVTTPVILGHEFAGEVVEIGAAVTNVDVGDLVSGEGHIVCGRCRNCLAGRRHLCANTVGIGVQRDGAFAEYVAIPAMNAWRHTHEVDLDVAAIFDPFGNAVHTALQFRVLGEDVLITGAGPIGIMAAAVVRHAGARNVVITDVSDYRLALARTSGVTLAVDTRTTSLAEVQATLGMKEGFDVGLEMSGHPAALSEMVANMAHGGRLALLGLPSGEVSVDLPRVVLSMLTLKGVYGREMFETWYEMSVLLQAGLDISPVITHRMSYADWAAGFDAAASGQCGKVVLNWESL